jgi:hypothetical protein
MKGSENSEFIIQFDPLASQHFPPDPEPGFLPSVDQKTYRASAAMKARAFS